MSGGGDGNNWGRNQIEAEMRLVGSLQLLLLPNGDIMKLRSLSKHIHLRLSSETSLLTCHSGRHASYVLLRQVHSDSGHHTESILSSYVSLFNHKKPE